MHVGMGVLYLFSMNGANRNTLTIEVSMTAHLNLDSFANHCPRSPLN